jgi:hypothetical protein
LRDLKKVAEETVETEVDEIEVMETVVEVVEETEVVVAEEETLNQDQTITIIIKTVGDNTWQ